MVTDYNINRITIGCATFIDMTNRDFFSVPATLANSHQSEFYLHNVQGISEVVALTSTTQPGIRRLSMFWSKFDCTTNSPREEDWETKVALVAYTGYFEYIFPSSEDNDNYLDGGDCTASKVFYRFTCANGKTDFTDPGDSFPFDTATGTIGIDTEWLEFSDRNHPVKSECIGVKYLSPYWPDNQKLKQLKINYRICMNWYTLDTLDPARAATETFEWLGKGVPY